jgi:hypothetical protein
MTKLVVAFCIFTNAPKNGVFGDSIHTVHSRVLSFLNIARFHGTRANVIGSLCTDLTNLNRCSQHYAQISRNDCFVNRIKILKMRIEFHLRPLIEHGSYSDDVHVTDSHSVNCCRHIL